MKTCPHCGQAINGLVILPIADIRNPVLRQLGLDENRVLRFFCDGVWTPVNY